MDWRRCRSVSRFQAGAVLAFGKAFSGEVDLGADQSSTMSDFENRERKEL